MFLDYTFEDRRCAGVVPHSFGVDDHNGAMTADAKAVDFGAANERPGHLEILQSLLEVVPRSGAIFSRAAFGLGRISADEDVALVLV
jgi:hypothetical protein